MYQAFAYQVHHSRTNEQIVHGAISLLLLGIAISAIVAILVTLRRHERRMRAMKHCDDWAHHSVTLCVAFQHLIAGHDQIERGLRQSFEELSDELSIIVLENISLGLRQAELTEWIAMEERCRVAITKWKELGLQLRDAVGSAN